MLIEFDPEKRNKTLAERGVDFADAAEIFAGRHFTLEDAREDYGESRFITVGMLKGRMVVLVWTPRGEARRIISLRKANERETTRYAHRVA
ncbi:BrnT family toxin [Methylococcus sp. ANG]|uniref:BrnT family toxin n=1 Tax=Methylococcus TaxID=413 RepID=UPI00224A5078|nr:BrnT family toxin [Methylococcus mesophilus]UZR30371.1 BrnT family toxin [Methylococcus mesophilus]